MGKSFYKKWLALLIVMFAILGVLGSGILTKNKANSSNAITNVSTKSHGLIKGNVNSKGEKIYHVPGGQYYDKTIPEQWFNTEEEAQKAGYRKSQR
jgi:hypothetical protein